MLAPDARRKPSCRTRDLTIYMWRTPDGERVLEGPEANLVRNAIADLAYWVEEEGHGLDDAASVGVTLFDALIWQQKLAMLAEVGAALFDPAVPSPKHSAINEATIAAIYATIRQHVENEIESSEPDDPDGPLLVWRELVHACLDDGQPWPPGVRLPAAACDDLDEWDWMLDAIEDRVLWDDDYEPLDDVMDGDPETAKYIKETLGIAPDYYTAVAPDPTESDLVRIRDTIKRVTGRSDW